MKKYVLPSLVVLLTFLLGFQVGRLSERKKQAPEETNVAAAVPTIDEEAELSAESNGVTIKDIVITNYKGEPVDLHDLANGRTIIARFSTSACKPCMDALTGSLGRIANDNPDQRIVLLMTGLPARDMYVLERQFGPQFSLLECKGLPIDFDEGQTPVVFRLDSALRVRDHFTCRYGDYARTDRYLDSIVSASLP